MRSAAQSGVGTGPRNGAVTGLLIEETRCLAEAVPALMPDDSAALTDLLTKAHRMLVSLVEALERGAATPDPPCSDVAART